MSASATKLLEFSTYLLPFVILIFLGLYLSQANSSGDVFNYFVWGVGILVPLLIALVVSQHISMVLSRGAILGVVIGVVSVFVFASFLYQRASINSYFLGQASNTISLILMAVFAFAILFSVLYSYTRYRTWTGFWMKLFFYIPCLVLDSIVDISNDLGITPRPVLVLFILEIILLVWYFFGDKIATWFRSKTNSGSIKRLQPTPIMLHTQQEIILANSETLRINKPQAMNEKNPYRKSYTISFWVFINDNDYITGYESPPEFNLLFYGSKVLDGDNKWQYKDPKPRVTYTFDKETNADTYLVYLDTKNPPYKLSIGNQKWNQFTFVYQDTIGNGHIDMFVNGHLVKSWGDILPPNFSANDKLSIGDDVNKLYGSIQNVTYYEYALAPHEVTNAFNYEYMNLLSI